MTTILADVTTCNRGTGHVTCTLRSFHRMTHTHTHRAFVKVRGEIRRERHVWHSNTRKQRVVQNQRNQIIHHKTRLGKIRYLRDGLSICVRERTVHTHTHAYSRTNLKNQPKRYGVRNRCADEPRPTTAPSRTREITSSSANGTQAHVQGRVRASQRRRSTSSVRRWDLRWHRLASRATAPTMHMRDESEPPVRR